MDLIACIHSTFEPVIRCSTYPRTQIDIQIKVLAADGGVLQAAVNATCLALQTAGIAMDDSVIGLACAIYNETGLLDPNAVEEQDLPYLTLAYLPRSGEISMVNMETRLYIDRFQALLDLAIKGAQVLKEDMEGLLRQNAEELRDKALGKKSVGQSRTD